MMLLFRWLANAAALLLIAWIIPGFSLDGVTAAIIAALVLGLVNALVRPLLVILTLPVTIMTLGLFLVVINALMLLLTSSLLPGFAIENFFTAVFGAILLWLASQLIGWVTKA